MLAVSLACALLVVVATLVHYEALRLMSQLLPGASVTPRAKLVLVILGSFVAHAFEISLYALAMYALIRWAGAGTLGGASVPSIDTTLYFSAETFSSLGYGDLVPHGPLRLLSGVETLNGLLLIGWSSSYAYMSMERYWKDSK
jgi:hypothetical protein